jgi:hypothetical protein
MATWFQYALRPPCHVYLMFAKIRVEIANFNHHPTRTHTRHLYTDTIQHPPDASSSVKS